MQAQILVGRAGSMGCMVSALGFVSIIGCFKIQALGYIRFSVELRTFRYSMQD